MSAEDVKWRKPVLPGDVLVIEVELMKTRGKIGKAKGVCKVGGEIVSEAEVTFMLRDAERLMICDLRLAIRNSNRDFHDSSTAIIHPKAHIGAGCEIGPYCVIGENVTLGDRCQLAFARRH